MRCVGELAQKISLLCCLRFLFLRGGLTEEADSHLSSFPIPYLPKRASYQGHLHFAFSLVTYHINKTSLVTCSQRALGNHKLHLLSKLCYSNNILHAGMCSNAYLPGLLESWVCVFQCLLVRARCLRLGEWGLEWAANGGDVARLCLIAAPPSSCKSRAGEEGEGEGAGALHRGVERVASLTSK